MYYPNSKYTYTKEQVTDSYNGLQEYHAAGETHIHQFAGLTSIDSGHNHAYVGTTKPAPYGAGHTHEYMTWTNFADGHRHQIAGRTGPAIPLQDGSHFHYYEGWTIGYTSHQHWYGGATMPSSGWSLTSPEQFPALS